MLQTKASHTGVIPFYTTLGFLLIEISSAYTALDQIIFASGWSENGGHLSISGNPNHKCLAPKSFKYTWEFCMHFYIL